MKIFNEIIFLVMAICECNPQMIDSRSRLQMKSNTNEEAVTEKIEESTTTTRPSSRPSTSICTLTWKQYDPYIDPYAPSQDGLLLGTYIDGSPIYVGRGSSNYFRRYSLPARVYVNESSSEAGVYVISYPNEYRDVSKTARYLVANPDYNYKWILSSQGQMEANGIGWRIGSYNTSISRINFTQDDGNFVSQIGVSISSVGTIFYNPFKNVVSSMRMDTYEALVCVPKDIEYEAEFCVHEWKHYDPASFPAAPSLEGFLVGSYYDNSSIYLGRGNDICNAITPARVNIISNTQVPGVFTSCNGIELIDSSETAEYLVKNPKYTYTWVNASSDDQFLNAVKWTYFSDTLAVSRVRIYNRKNKEYFVTVGKTFVGAGTWYYNPVTKYTESLGKKTVEMLICSPKGGTEAIKAVKNGCVHTWKPLENPELSQIYLTDGIMAGNYIDGAPIYVGIGFQVNTSDIVPARVTVSGSMEPGVYVLGNDDEYIDRGESGAYLVYNDSQVYEWVKTKPKYYVRNAIEINSLYYSYTIARINITDERLKTFSQIGTNYVNVATYYFNPLTGGVNNMSDYLDYVEILTCVVKGEN